MIHQKGLIPEEASANPQPHGHRSVTRRWITASQWATVKTRDERGKNATWQAGTCFCVFPLLISHYSGLTTAVCSVWGVAKYSSLWKTKRDPGQKPRESLGQPGLSSTTVEGRDSPTYRNRVYFYEGWFSQHLARAYSLPAILNHPPGSTTLAIKSFPNPGQSYTSGSLWRVACALGANRWPRGLCWHEETVRRSGTLPVARDPPLQVQATCVQSHTPDPSKAAAFCPPPLSY